MTRCRDDDDRAAGSGCATGFLPAALLGTAALRDPLPNDIELPPCKKAMPGVLVMTLLAMWLHRRELPALWRGIGGVR